MATLWKRASPRELKVLRIIAGAVINTRDAHPGHSVDKKFARGVANQWEGVLAASERRPSLAERRTCLDARGNRGSSAIANGRSPVLAIVKQISNEVGRLRKLKQHDSERALALIDVLRIIDREINK